MGNNRWHCQFKLVLVNDDIWILEPFYETTSKFAQYLRNKNEQ